MAAPNALTSRDGAATCVAENVFSREAIAYLNAIAEASRGASETGGIVQADATPTTSDVVRRSEVAWFHDTPENRPIYQLIAECARHANNQVFHLDLTGFNEPFQLATYYATNQGYYGWHMDIGAGPLANRKLSLVVPLTDPSEFEGGEFQAFHGYEPTTVDLPLGCVLAFPSYLLHRVTPVTKGIRRSLAIWVSGPPFR